ncbi:MAG: amino acid adenylation domain-containing protein [Bacteroidetes bacterium]|nr:amino acid adenylation domain-containing protein [Bacteroidota bacterium]
MGTEPVSAGEFGIQYAGRISRHEILRTVFVESGEGLVEQLVLECMGFSVAVHDYREGGGLSASELREEIASSLSSPFDLSRGPLLRSSLYLLGEGRSILTYTMHHIISDGWSMGVLLRELLSYYNKWGEGISSVLPSLRIHYGDYSEWQQRGLVEGDQSSSRIYWKQVLGGELPVLDLPGDRARPVVKTYNGGSVLHRMGSEWFPVFRSLLQSEGCTLFMGLVSLVKALLYRYTGQEDIIVGTTVAGREEWELENQLGFYVNTLVLRTVFSGTEGYRELLLKEKEVLLGAYDHQSYPFDELVEELNLRRDISRNPLFDVQVILQDSSGLPEEKLAGGLQVKEYEGYEKESSLFDLTFQFYETEECLVVRLDYNSDIYNKSTAERICSHLEGLLRSVSRDSTTGLNQLDYIGEGELSELLQREGPLLYEAPIGKTIVDLFEEQVTLYSDRIALVCGESRMSYAELDERSSALSAYLRTVQGVRKGDRVGIMLDRSLESVLCIIGVLKSGAAYVPVDPLYPVDRISYMLSDADCRVVITDSFYQSYQSSSFLEFEVVKESLGMEDLAYVIYTSGSTGRPKGVMIHHGGIVNTIYGQQQAFVVEPGERHLQFASLSFDASVSEIFVSLCSGCTLYVVPGEIKQEPLRMESYLQENRIDMATLPPVYFSMLSTEGLRGLKKLITAGESAIYDKCVEYSRYGQYYNAYGPTEASICATIYAYGGGKHGSGRMPVGRPIINTRVYILDGERKPVPAGVVGEIYISGLGVSMGYLNQAEQTGIRFMEDKFNPGHRMYRTGDMGRWLESWEIEFLGRRDTQLKIRGYRIEAGEIENCLLGCKGVESCVVTDVESASGERELVAYVTSAVELQEESMRAHLQGKLPVYMLPAQYVQLKQLPQTPNGKIDRKALPVPSGMGLGRSRVFAEAETAMQSVLVSIWQELLGREVISIDDNFFELGGNSIKIIKLAKPFRSFFLRQGG